MNIYYNLKSSNCKYWQFANLDYKQWDNLYSFLLAIKENIYIDITDYLNTLKAWFF